MPNCLIIVESPSKARTLAKFLGSQYTVKASMGHVRDLPKSKIGVDVEAGFLPEYTIIKGKEKQIKELKDAAKKADSVLLAADPDREGEAIAWHLAQALKLVDPDRIVFHEITRSAVEAALNEPRKIDRNLVAAQEARRVIDRLVGYRLSPLLWRKVRTGLSAGRVQSVAVRLVVDREHEIEAFITTESWSVDALVSKDGGAPFPARLIGLRQGEARIDLDNEDAARSVARALGFDGEGRPGPRTPAFTVAAMETKDVTRQGPTPYTTSTLQQDASTRLRLSPRRTMSIAQELYEGVDLGSAGSTGLITYMRTDSMRISEMARAAAAEHITASLGRAYVRTKAARIKARENVQDAHEAIRPTDVTRTPESIAEYLSPAQQRLYDLVWRRFMASQMAASRSTNTSATIHAGDYAFRASGSVMVFDGFTKVWRRDEENRDTSLPPLAEQDALAAQALQLEQHFTQPPPRYTEASLIKELEERGIGRPSTYAPTIEVVQERNYVKQEERRLHPTELGKTVDTVLREHFPAIVDIDFTAALEKRLDGIEEGSSTYEPTVREWYGPFNETVVRAQETMQRVKVPARETGQQCPLCEEGMLVVREGRFGEFTGCSRYPECKYIVGKDPAGPQQVGEDCPNCGKPLVVRHGRRGAFAGCSGYPTCRFIKGEAVVQPGADGGAATVQVITEDLGPCPECSKPLRRMTSRRGPFVGCSGYPKCKYIQPRAAGADPAEGGTAAAASTRTAAEPTGEACPECQQPLVTRSGRFGPFVSCSGYPKCKYRPPKSARSPAAATGAR